MNLKNILIISLLALVALFSVQNAQVISVRFLHWRLDLSQALVILLAVIAGMLVGWVLGTFGRRSRAKPAEPTTPPEPRQPSSGTV